MPYSAQQIHSQEVGMRAAAKLHFGDRFDDLDVQEILAHALSCVREHDSVISRRTLRQIVRAEVRARMGLFWTSLLWWAVPRLVAWVVTWWIENRNK